MRDYPNKNSKFDFPLDKFDDKSDWALIYSSENISNNKKAEWLPITIQKTVLTYEDHRPIKFEVLDLRDSGDHKLVGGVILNYQEITEKQSNNFKIGTLNKKPAGSLMFGSVS